MIEIPPPLFLLLPLSLAAGLDLYLTLFVFTTAGFLGLGIQGGEVLSSPIGVPILTILAGLYFTETALEFRPFPAFVWHSLQLLLRPLGAALLGLFLLRDEALGLLLLGVTMAGVVAAFSHVLIWGLGLLLRLVPEPHVSPVVLNFAGDVLALGLVILALSHQGLAVLLATLLLLLGLVFGGSCHGVARFGLALLVDRVWGIVSPNRWRERNQLPSWIRNGSLQEFQEVTRGARAATWNLTGRGRFRDGWILQGNGEYSFTFRLRRTPHLVELTGVEEKAQLGPFAKTVVYRSPQDGPSALFLQMGLIGPESHK